MQDHAEGTPLALPFADARVPKQFPQRHELPRQPHVRPAHLPSVFFALRSHQGRVHTQKLQFRQTGQRLGFRAPSKTLTFTIRASIPSSQPSASNEEGWKGGASQPTDTVEEGRKKQKRAEGCFILQGTIRLEPGTNRPRRIPCCRTWGG